MSAPATAGRHHLPQLLLLLDVDFAVSLSLAKLVDDPASYASLMAGIESRHAWVLPAFETLDGNATGVKVAIDAVRLGKANVVKKFK